MSRRIDRFPPRIKRPEEQWLVHEAVGKDPDQIVRVGIGVQKKDPYLLHDDAVLDDVSQAFPDVVASDRALDDSVPDIGPPVLSSMDWYVPSGSAGFTNVPV